MVRLVLLAIIIFSLAPRVVCAGAPNVIDGSVHPELISDFSAFEMFLQMLAVPANAPPSQIAGTIGKVTTAGLDESDIALLLQQLVVFQSALMDICDRQAALSSQPAAAATSAASVLDREYRMLIKRTIKTLRQTLSPEGVPKMQAYVMAMKNNMTRRCLDSPCPPPGAEPIE
jgi:hypothetical protein